MSAVRTPARPDPAAPGLEYRGLAVGYGEREVLAGVDLTVARGEIVGLVGPNGAGKSTLLRAVTGAPDVTAGSLAIAGLPADSLDARERACVVAVVPQTPPSLFGFTAREFVALGRHPHLGRIERPDQADERVVDEAMMVTDTARLALERVDRLSGGDLQRLTLAQALAQEPHVLLLDEPTSHLDLNHRLQVLDLVRDLADGGLAVLAVFHDLDMAARYSDRVAVVSGGGLGPVGRPDVVLTQEILSSVFSVRAVIGTDAVTGSVTITPVVREQATAAPSKGRVLVLGGSGAAAPLLRRLVLAGFEVSSAALNRGDIDQGVADALGVEYVELPPFGQIGDAERTRVLELAAAADARIVCEVPFGGANLGNLEAVAAAGAPLAFVGGFPEGRDFAGGRALALAARAFDAGALAVDGVAGAVAFAEEHAATPGART